MRDKIGLLALQGAVEPHAKKFKQMGIPTCAVRQPQTLDQCYGLVLPGGESTTMLLLLQHHQLIEPLYAFAKSRPLWGVCAGSILMAKKVCNPAQESLNLLPVTVTRNAYGRQNESFIGEVSLTQMPPDAPNQRTEAVFIRAPQLTDIDAQMQVLATHQNEPVAVQHQHHMACTFHPELSSGNWFHQHFIDLCTKHAHQG